jgi:putative transposase
MAKNANSLLLRCCVTRTGPSGTSLEGRARYPRFKRKHEAQSVRYQLGQRQVHRTFSDEDHRLVLPKLGPLKLRWSREVEGVPKMVTVRRDACGRYFSQLLLRGRNQAPGSQDQSCQHRLRVKDVVITSAGPNPATRST